FSGLSKTREEIEKAGCLVLLDLWITCELEIVNEVHYLNKRLKFYESEIEKRNFVDRGVETDWLGVVNAFLVSYIKLFELNQISDDKLTDEELNETFSKNKMRRLIKKSDEIIRISKNNSVNNNHAYPKFYAVRGKLKSLVGEYDNAIADINSARSYESSDETDYSLRINGYKNDITFVKHLKMSREADESYSKIEILSKEFEKSKVKQLEIIGAFVTVLGLILGSLSFVAKSESFIDAGKLIVVLFSCVGILISFYSIVKLIYVTNGKLKKNKLKISLLVGGVISILGIIVGFAMLIVYLLGGL
ncbi:MAG: hypothetical protein ACRC4L_02615, partial [Mycoplasma sp.]